MKDFDELQLHINRSFQVFFDSLLKIEGIPRKYFYWSEEYFRVEGNLEFAHFTLSGELKDNINELGNSFFDSEDIIFYVNRYSHRSDLTIKNIAKLFDNKNKKDQSQRYEYIKEFTFYELLSKQLQQHKKTLNNNYKKPSLKKKDELYNEEIKQLETEIKHLEKVIPIQRNNYLITYIQYVIINGHSIHNKEYSEFRNSLPTQYQEITTSLDIIKHQSGKDNQSLRKKIDSLYIHKKYKSKIHFIFSKDGGAEKEELRELLDIMSKDDAGEYYRGQAVSSWILNASITREPKYLKYEADMYYDILSLKPEAFKNDIGVYDRLITMQHYGMPTRLLDITRNPLVAIFFACNNMERKESDGIVFTFSPNDEMKFLNFEDNRLNALEAIYKNETYDSEFLKGISYLKGVAKNQRINNQSGDFIFIGTGNGIKEKINDLPEKYIIIDAESKAALLEQLETLNIHAGSVYPDLSHISSYISHKYRRLSDLKKEPEKIATPETSNLSNIVPDIPAYEDFWTNDRVKKFNKMVSFHSLNKLETESVIDFYLRNRDFPDYKLLNVLEEQPPLMERERYRIELKDLLNQFILS
ncbi:FRG domain-containing protein [Carboxylicivirga taeanensis]|uniref:FRG domain-containing protein n=1 Tax=Carboxylicivirga taeanensis TaxID=1416875 RepID=UPI003F6E31EE